MASDQALRDLILASNPVVYYPLNNPSNLGLDLSANAHHGSQSGTFSQQIKTLFGMDLTMTKGVSSPLVTVPDRAEFRGNKLTIELVVAGVADENVVWLERGGANNNWSVQSYTSAQAPGQVPAFGSFLGVPTTPSVFQGAASNLPGLAHIVLVMDGAKLSTAVNGTVSQTSINTGSGSQAIQTAVPLHLFSRGGTAGPSNGYMAHLAIYNRILTSDEILARSALFFGAMGWEVHHLTATLANQEPRSQFQPQDVAWRGSPPLFAGPVLAQELTQFPMIKGRDYFWLRDGVRNVEQGYIESTVTIDGEGVARRVLCFTQSGELVAETTSRASDGKYRFDLLWLNRRYMLVAQDDPAFGPADYNAVAADFQLPKPYAPGEGIGLTGA
ncbi:LamG-like jellyroll fold domain-containing protein [Aeromonas aquatica]|uniref:LamG-like jellyroll fold domain-containing protein n=1 Tax=Aeromonas aquatica TaxID=558964 RepID=UPI00068E25E6|nr:LamG-like jellyroll fold domain-containing protein [Aeromonas aquatica]